MKINKGKENKCQKQWIAFNSLNKLDVTLDHLTIKEIFQKML